MWLFLRFCLLDCLLVVIWMPLWVDCLHYYISLLMYHIYVKSRGRLHTCPAHLLSFIECKSCASLYLCMYLSFDVDRVAYIVGLRVITRTGVQS